MRQQLVETIKGTGTVCSNNGDESTVQYELKIFQDQIPVGTLENPHETLPGLTEIRGFIRPVSFFNEDGLTLRMQDGRKLKFFFTRFDGSIVSQGWVE